MIQIDKNIAKSITLTFIVSIIIISIFYQIPVNFKFTDSTSMRVHTATSNSLSDFVAGNYGDSAHPPLIFILYKIYFQFLDPFNEFLVSLPTFFFFISSITILFYVTMKLFGLAQAFLVISLFIANNLMLKYVAGIENMFLFLFFAILSFYFFYKSFILNDEKSKWFLVTSNVLMVWSYHAAYFILIGQFSFLLIHRKKELFSTKNLRYVITFFVLSFPILAQTVISLLDDSITKSPINVYTYSNINFFENIIINIYPGIDNLFLNKFKLLLLILISATIIFATIATFMKNDKNKIVVYYLVPFLIIIPFLLNTRAYYPRYNVAFYWLIFITISNCITFSKKIIFKISKDKLLTIITLIFIILFVFMNSYIAAKNNIINTNLRIRNSFSFNEMTSTLLENDYDLVLLMGEDYVTHLLKYNLVKTVDRNLENLFYLYNQGQNISYKDKSILYIDSYKYSDFLFLNEYFDKYDKSTLNVLVFSEIKQSTENDENKLWQYVNHNCNIKMNSLIIHPYRNSTLFSCYFEN